MLLGKKRIIAMGVLSALGVCTVEAEKSVFIISKHAPPSCIQAYSIENDQVTYETQVDIGIYGQGAVGNAVWAEKKLMFVTYEGSPVVLWFSTTTLRKVGEFVTGIENCAGIAVDEAKEKIYIVCRDTDDLYVYSWDEGNDTLVLDDHYDLEVPSGYLTGWGLALDEANDFLYISTRIL